MSAIYDCTASGSDVLQALYSELTRTLDARVVAANMYQRNALTLRELQSIQSLRDCSVEAAETLLNIIMEQPDAVFLCFLDVLKCGEQPHIYQRLVQDGYRGLYERFDEIPHWTTPDPQNEVGVSPALSDYGWPRYLP